MANWTDSPATTSTRVRAIHINEVRRTVNRNLQSAGLSPHAWTDNPVTPFTRIRATHFTEIRSAIQGYMSVPNWSVGSAPSATRQISTRDINDLRSWTDSFSQARGLPAGPAPGVDPASVGVYADITISSQIQSLAQLGWPGVADIGGIGSAAPPYTQPTGQDANVASGLEAYQPAMWWISYWTVSGPRAGDSWVSAGNQGGLTAVATLALLSRTPLFVVLDAEGAVVPSTQQQWYDFISGWGQAFAGTRFSGAFYSSQSDYQTYNLSGAGLPAFEAVSPILNNSPFVSGVQGYAAYYGSCPAGTETNQVANWGAYYSTIQFGNSQVGTQFPSCGPS